VTILFLDDYAPAPLAAPDVDALGRIDVLPDEFRAPVSDASGQYMMRAELLLPGDFLLVGSCTWMRVLDVTPTGWGDRFAVSGRQAAGHALTVHVSAARLVRVWHPADILIYAVLGESAGGAR
jgi:hypothetical protein